MLSGNRAKTTIEQLRQKPLWQHLNVVRHNQVCFVGEHWHESDVYAINAILDDLFRALVETPLNP
jgi:ABC-type Fe3+-hydroxamate transport system substrate-binding protein